VEWGVQQSRKLKESGVPCLHYYTMGKSEVVRKIASEVF
jgi:methylenetetrahydrofolate reductase (NADPH)